MHLSDEDVALVTVVMGTGGSFLRGNSKDTEDDVLGTEYDGNGVIKRIPIEVRVPDGPDQKLGFFGSASRSHLQPN